MQQADSTVRQRHNKHCRFYEKEITVQALATCSAIYEVTVEFSLVTHIVSFICCPVHIHNSAV